MNKQVTLTIKLDNLKKIVSGEKNEEYRAVKQYYIHLFGPANKEGIVNNCGFIKLVCKNKSVDYWAIIEVKEIAHEKFVNFIPENFKKNDTAYTIYIKKVVDHNLKL